MASFTRTGTILDQILENTQAELAERKRQVPQAAMTERASAAPPPRSWAGVFERDTIALIAEVKHASPSKGVLIDPYDPVALACTYEANGAAAISVLTDTRFFQGSLAHLSAVRDSVSVPVLRKDFIIDPLQVYEGRAAGADAILLIAAALDDEQLAELYKLAHLLGMAALVEVHNEAECERALKINPTTIGINNRDLKTFQVDLAVTERLSQIIPNSVQVVAESGIHAPDDIRRMAQAGAHAVLVGESLVTAQDVPAQVKMRQPAEKGHAVTKVKICGVTSFHDALAAAEAGADMIGLNFYQPSPRYIEPEDAAEFASALREMLGATCPMLVGVFVNAELSQMHAIADWVGLDFLQLHGDESPDLIARLKRPVIKALRPKDWDEAHAQVERYSDLLKATENPMTLLLDAYHADLYGGTGDQASAEIAVAVNAAVPRLILAGGLTPENVAERVAAVKPWGVDTASGVESGDPRRKDHGKIQAFIRSAKSTGGTADD